MSSAKIGSSDRQIAPNVFVSLQALYNKVNINALQLAKDANHILNFMRKHKILNLPENIQVRICGINAKNTRARITRYCLTNRFVIEVDYRITSKRAFIESICHELVHAEQYNMGRLEYAVVAGQYVAHWNGTPHHQAARTYDQYRAQPWETEAFKRQVELANMLEQPYYFNIKAA